MTATNRTTAGLPKAIAITFAMASMTAAVSGQAPASVAGTWNGAIETPAVRLAIVVRLQSDDTGAWDGTIDIPQQGAKGVRLDDIAVNSPNVSFRISGAPGIPSFASRSRTMAYECPGHSAKAVVRFL